MGCRAALRFPVREKPLDYDFDRTVLDTMNPHLLSNELTDRLVVEIDWVEGMHPSDRAMNALKETLQRYAPQDKKIDVVLDDEIPFEEWEVLPTADTWTLTQKWLDVVPDLSRKLHVLYILYVPRSSKEHHSYYGFHAITQVQRGDLRIPVESIAMFMEPIRQKSILMIRNSEGERATLIHELGHAFGLCSNWEHEQRGNPNHCRNVECVVTEPRTRSIAYNFLPGLFAGRLPRNYCDDCRADLARYRTRLARELEVNPKWAERTLSRMRAEIESESLSWRIAQNEDPRALDELEELSREYPESARLAERVTINKLWLGQSEDALEFALRGYQADRYHAVGLKAAALLARRGRTAEALEILSPEYLAAQGQEGIGAHLERARILTGLRRIEDALLFLQDTRRSRRKDYGETMQLTLAISKLYRLSGRPKRSLSQLNKIPRPMRLDSRVVFERAKAFERLGRKAGARRILKDYAEAAEQLYQANPQTTPLPTWVLAEAKLGNPEQVEELLTRLRTVAERSRWHYYPILRAQSYAQLGDLPAAWDVVESTEFATSLRRAWTFDLCGDEELAPLRTEARFATRFPQCSRLGGSSAALSSSP
jgi:hypothetical protein